MKLSKNTTYLVKIQENVEKKTFWLVQQVSQRGWVATRFTQPIDSYGETNHIEGNSIVTVERMEKLLAIGEELDWRTVHSKSALRQEMYSVLTSGRFSDESNS